MEINVYRKISCPLCTLNFRLPHTWATSPFRCPGCNAQLQAKLRYAKAVPYSWGALAFLAFLIAGGRWRFILAIVFYPSMLILSLLFAQLSPLDVKPYDLNIVSGNPHK
jgi:hypothetical protein